MEMMSLPSKEVLTFSKKIRPWIVGDEPIAGKRKFIFEDGTPQDILDLYDKIKPRLEFAY